MSKKVPVSNKKHPADYVEIKVGQTVSISDAKGEICRAKVLDVDAVKKVINIRPTSGERSVTQFCFLCRIGWKMLFEDLGGSRSFSKRAPSYSIIPM